MGEPAGVCTARFLVLALVAADLIGISDQRRGDLLVRPGDGRPHQRSRGMAGGNIDGLRSPFGAYTC